MNAVRPLITADDVAIRLGVPKSWVYDKARSGHLPSVDLGRYVRFDEDAIEEFIKNGGITQ